MAILLVNIEDRASLVLNEFFDYNGHCYALSCRRDRNDGVAITFNDFYDSTVATKHMSDMPVVFCEKDDTDVYIIGWYKKAEVYSRSRNISLFLEGNIVANSADVFLLKQKYKPKEFTASFMFKNYIVIEPEDGRYDQLVNLIFAESRINSAAENAFVRYPYIHVELDSRARKSYEVCINYCERIAASVMNNQCQGIAELKALYVYAKEATETKKNSVDGYYYLAMACYQLGLLKEGIKTVEKALKFEPEAADINALKANILISMGHYDAAVELYKKAAQFDMDNSDEYNRIIDNVIEMKNKLAFERNL